MKARSTDEWRQRLLNRIRRKYRVVTQAVEVGPVRVGFTRVADPDAVLDQMAEAEDRREKTTGRRVFGEELHLPYWAELWDSAPGVGQWMVEARLIKRGMTVLDLGCGMGLSGTVAAALGAEVTFADLEPAALLFARLNSLPWRERVRARRLNWRTDELGERFDLIVGADILYEKEQWPYLEPFWRMHLTEAGVVVLGEPGRQTGDLFLEWIRGKGWAVERGQERVATRQTPVRIFALRRSTPDR